MKKDKMFKAASPVALAILVASCGGASTVTGSDKDNEPDAGSANGSNAELPDSLGQNVTTDTGTVLSGRVADGYIQGATVCIDLNNSNSCENDEPSAVTGAGGAYELSIPAGAEDKPIVADIPAAAIDEDTGEAVGQPLVFIAPAGQPEFISPITTLVHQELQSNPSLDTEDAEIAVKTLLGIAEEDVSLFTDYVAGGQEEQETEERKNNFRYLHDTARVVASMMKDIETEVESAAQTTGIDVVGSKDTQLAIQDIVRREVQQLLPQIANQIATVDRTGATDATSSGAANEQGTLSQNEESFDPEQIALSLRPVSLSENVQARIDAVVERMEPIQTDLRKTLTDGVYWMEFDCHYQEEYAGTSDSASQGNFATTGNSAEPGELTSTPVSDVSGVQPGAQPVSENMDNDASTGYSAQNCTPSYNKAQLNDTGDELLSRTYDFDKNSGTWTETPEDIDVSSDYFLIEGEWQEQLQSTSGSLGKIIFSDDTSAALDTSEGNMELKATTQDLSATEVKKHLYADINDPAWFHYVLSSDFFSADTQAHVISVKRKNTPHIIFNRTPYGDDEKELCADYANNCNVIGTISDNQLDALQSLAHLRRAALEGTKLLPMHNGIGPGATMTFKSIGAPGEITPTSGSVMWSFGDATQTGSSMSESEVIPEPTTVDSNPGEVPETPFTDVDLDGCFEPEVNVSDEDQPLPGQAFPLVQLLGTSLIGTLDSTTQIGIDAEPMPGEKPDSFSTINATQSPEDEATFAPDFACPDIVMPSGLYKDPLSEKVEATDQAAYMSQWKTIMVDGVEMIEIQIPQILRLDGDSSEQAILLAEHDGYVRLGSRKADYFFDRIATYNETAFSVLRAMVERSKTPE